ncbi:MAG: hypothetical protein IJ124_06480 [Clostridia bacterium]|nr:hypothetical protein [Clostridia bacterium]
MEKRDRLKKLSRYELVELIYELRQDNVELEKRCREAELKVAELEQLTGKDSLGERLGRMEGLLRTIQGRLDAEEEKR